MAIAISTSAGASGANTVALNIGSAGTDRLVVIALGVENATNDVTGVTVDGKSATLIHEAENPDGAGNSGCMYYILEATLGASNGSVTITAAGGDSSYGIVAQVFTGVNQSVPNDSNFNATAVGGTTISVTGIDTDADGLIVAAFGHGQSGRTGTYTTPLVERQSVDPVSAQLYLASGIEPSSQSNKTYTITLSGSNNRGVGFAASWGAAVTSSSSSSSSESSASSQSSGSSESSESLSITYHLAGVTKDEDGNTKASCICHLWKYNSGTPYWVAYTLSDGSGDYDFTGLGNNDEDYYVESHKADDPHTMDITDHVLQPVEE